MENNTFDITGINLYDLIRELWNNTLPLGYGFFHNIPPSDSDIENSIDDGYIDYLNGRPIKTYFKDPKSVNSSLYDRDAGPGTFKTVVNKLRQQQ